MRKAGELPYDWLADNTRSQRKLRTYDGIEDALESTARFYRKDLWSTADRYVEIWLEKDALAGVVLPVTSTYDVPLMVARGYASLSFLHTAAEYIDSLDIPAHIYHLGDFDPSGVNAGEKIEQTLREMAPDWRSTSSALQSSRGRLVNGGYRLDQQRHLTPALRTLAMCQWSSMRLSRRLSAPSLLTPSSAICQGTSSTCSRPPKRASARSSAG